jgi:putative transposase
MHEQRGAFPVRRMCQLLEVSPSGYYEGLGRPPHSPGEAAQQVQARVQPYFTQGRGTYGTRRIKHL